MGQCWRIKPMSQIPPAYTRTHQNSQPHPLIREPTYARTFAVKHRLLRNIPTLTLRQMYRLANESSWAHSTYKIQDLCTEGARTIDNFWQKKCSKCIQLIFYVFFEQKNHTSTNFYILKDETLLERLSGTMRRESQTCNGKDEHVLKRSVSRTYQKYQT